jgi:hypothetical protein
MSNATNRIYRLNKSLKKNRIGKDIQKQIMNNFISIDKHTKDEKVVECFCKAIDVMDKLLDKNTKQKIREGCACCIGGKRQELCEDVNKKI